ncbi:hypothetical protein HDU96_000010 [Phlyctochytrium bullatum]|nr:hypothetical protein HDU96_000010 [Phlyctochytrium bullatum]
MDRLLRRSTSPAPPASNPSFASTTAGSESVVEALHQHLSTAATADARGRSSSPARATSLKRPPSYIPSSLSGLLGIPSASPAATSPALTASSPNLAAGGPVASLAINEKGLSASSPNLGVVSAGGGGSTQALSATKARLKNDLLGLLSDPASADVHLVVGDDRVEFYGHRIILIARSDYFRKLLAAAALDPRSPLRIELLFLDPDAFRIVLRHLYTAEEEDEATNPTSEDWRLILECYRTVEFLGVGDRSPTYLSCFASLFRRLARRNHRDRPEDRETCSEMWTAADAYQLDDLLVACAADFWKLFGTAFGSSSSPLESAAVLSPTYGGTRREIARLLSLGNRLETLVKVLNAIPAHLEPPVGKFRIVRSWLMSQPPPASSPDGDGSAAAVEAAAAPARTPSQGYRPSVGSTAGSIGGRRPSSAVIVTSLWSVSAGHSFVEEGGTLYRLQEESPLSPVTPGDDKEGSSPPSHEGTVIHHNDQEGSSRSPPQSPPPGPNSSVVVATPTSRRRRESYLSTITTSSSGVASSVGPPSSAGWRKGQPTVGLIKEVGVAGTAGAGGGGGNGSPVGSNGRSPSQGGQLPGPGSAGGASSSGFPARGLAASAMELRASRQKVLTRLNLQGITATDLAEEVEPSGILSDRHLLSLYRAAALEKEHPPLWMPVPVGFSQSQNHHAPFISSSHHGGLSLGRRNTITNAKTKTVTLMASHVGPGFVTYCLADPVASGRHVWSVVPLTTKDGMVGIGVSADSVLGSGASPAASSAPMAPWGPLSPLASESLAFGGGGPMSPVPAGGFLAPADDGMRVKADYHLPAVPPSASAVASPRFSQPSLLSPTGAAPGTTGERERRGSSFGPSTLVELPPTSPRVNPAEVVTDALKSFGTAVTSLWTGQPAPGDEVRDGGLPRSRPSSPVHGGLGVTGVSDAGRGRFGNPDGVDPAAVMAAAQLQRGGGAGAMPIPTASNSGNGGAYSSYGEPSPLEGHAFPQPPRAPPPTATAMGAAVEGSQDYFSIDPVTLSRTLKQHQAGAPSPVVNPSQLQPPQPYHQTPTAPSTLPRSPHLVPDTLAAAPPSSGLVPPPRTAYSGATGPLTPGLLPGGGGAAQPPRFVGEDGGWSLWSDGSLRVGRILVGRLPSGVQFSRGTVVTVKLDMDARTLSFEVGGRDCGVAFRNLPAPIFPSVVFLGGGGGLSATVTWHGTALPSNA